MIRPLRRWNQKQEASAAASSENATGLNIASPSDASTSDSGSTTL